MVEDLVAPLTPPGDHGCTGRHAYGVGRVGAIEAYALSGKTIHIRSAEHGVVNAHRVPALLIGGDEEDIGRGICTFLLAVRETYEKCRANLVMAPITASAFFSGVPG